MVEYIERAQSDWKRARLAMQWHEAVTEHSITCGCGKPRAIEIAYRCLYCGEWFCFECGRVHFGPSIEEEKKMSGGQS